MASRQTERGGSAGCLVSVYKEHVWILLDLETSRARCRRPENINKKLGCDDLASDPGSPGCTGVSVLFNFD